MAELDVDLDLLGTRQDLAARLTQLREARGLTVRELAAAADVPVATVGGYLAGRHLPPLAATDQLLRVLTVLGVPDDELDQWVAAVTRIRRAPGPRAADSPAPYRGLAAYQPQDAAVFVGRELVTARLVERVCSGPALPVVVIGPSGSGKSSLLRAGLVAALRAQGQTVEVTTPSALGSELDDAAPGSVLVLDQLEEAFAAQPSVARALVTALAAAADRGVGVVVALRSDFFDQALAVEPIGQWVAAGPVVVPALTTDDLRRVVLEPARAVGLEVDAALVDVLVAEACEGTGSDHELDPGALPLVSHALDETWRASAGHRLTLEHYREAGGFRGAVAKSAEDMFASLSTEQQGAAYRTILRLVHVRDGVPDTRRSADRSEFTDPDAAAVLDACVAARLVSTDRDRVQLAHESLLAAWPRLRAWLEENREALRVRGQLTEAVGHWMANDRSPDLLYRGTALERLEALLAGGAVQGLALAGAEQDFVEASRVADRARQVTRRRATQRLRALAAALAVVALVAAGLAVAAWRQTGTLGRERDLAVSRQLAVTSRYLAGTDPGLSAEVALAASDAAETLEGRSALLSASSTTPVSLVAQAGGLVNALAISPDGTWIAVGTEASQVELWSLTGRPELLGTIAVGKEPVYAVAVSADGGTVFAGGGDHTLGAWDVSDPAAPSPLDVAGTDIGATVYGIALDEHRGLVAAASYDGSVHLWRTSARGLGAEGSLDLFEGTVQTVAFVGDRLAAAGSEGLLALVDVTDPAAPALVGPAVVAADGQVTDLDLAPDGHTLAVSSYDYTVHLWDVADPAAPVAGPVLTGPATWVNGVDFSPDGLTLAAASSDKRLWTWDVATGAATRSWPDPASLIAVTWDATGSALYVGGVGSAVREWSFPGSTVVGLGSVPAQVPVADGLLVTATRDGLRVLDATDPEQPRPLSLTPAPGDERLDGALAYSATLGLAIAGTRSGVAVVWDLTDPAEPELVGTLDAHSTWIELVDVDDSGTRLALCSDDGSVSLWDLSDGLPDRPTAVITGDPTKMIYGAEFSPDGTKLVVAALTAREVRLYDVTDLAAPRLVAGPLPGPTDYPYSATFSPDGTLVAASFGDGSWWLWDVSGPQQPVVLAGPLVWAEGYSRSVTFAPDGAMLAEAMTDGTVRLWDLTDPGRPSRYATLEGVVGTVYGVGYWPDGRHLNAAGADRTVRVFNTSVADAAAGVCGAIDRGLPMSERDWARVAGTLPFPQLCS